MKNLFEMKLDDFSVKVVADSEEEAIEFCYKCFDYDKVLVKFIENVYCACSYPYFPGKGK